MSINALSNTTLSANIDGKQVRFAVASTAGISGLGSVSTLQSALVVDGEKMLVQGIPVSGTVEVIRGVDGTAAKPHASGSLVFFGAKTAFGGLRDGAVELVGTGGVPDGSLPEYRLPLGSSKKVNGKEYVLCDFTETVYAGEVVSISNDGLFTCGSTMLQGAVGVVSESSGSSDQWGWVQIYGYASAQESAVTSGATSAYIAVVSTTAATPPTGLYAIVGTTSTPLRHIYNMFITGAATTATTATASHTGTAVPVFLNYPTVQFAATDMGFS